MTRLTLAFGGGICSLLHERFFYLAGLVGWLVGGWLDS